MKRLAQRWDGASAETRKERARSQGTPHSFLSCWAGCGAAARPPPAAWRPVLGRRAGLGAPPPGCAVTGSGSPQGHIPPLHETTHRCSEGAGVSHVASHRGTGKAGTQGQAHRPGRAGCREPAAVAPPGGGPLTLPSLGLGPLRQAWTPGVIAEKPPKPSVPPSPAVCLRHTVSTHVSGGAALPLFGGGSGCLTRVLRGPTACSERGGRAQACE